MEGIGVKQGAVNAFVMGTHAAMLSQCRHPPLWALLENLGSGSSQSSTRAPSAKRISDEVRISLERVAHEPEASKPNDDRAAEAPSPEGKLASSKIAQKLGLKTGPFLERAARQGFLEFDNGQFFLSPKGEKVGVEFVAKSRFGPYFLWPQDFYLV